MDPRMAKQPMAISNAIKHSNLHKTNTELGRLPAEIIDDLEDAPSVLTDRSLAIEQVFTATHGRAMTSAERRYFAEEGRRGMD